MSTTATYNWENDRLASVHDWRDRVLALLIDRFPDLKPGEIARLGRPRPDLNSVVVVFDRDRRRQRPLMVRLEGLFERVGEAVYDVVAPIVPAVAEVVAETVKAIAPVVEAVVAPIVPKKKVRKPVATGAGAGFGIRMERKAPRSQVKYSSEIARHAAEAQAWGNKSRRMQAIRKSHAKWFLDENTLILTRVFKDLLANNDPRLWKLSDILSFVQNNINSGSDPENDYQTALCVICEQVVTCSMDDLMWGAKDEPGRYIPSEHVPSLVPEFQTMLTLMGGKRERLLRMLLNFADDLGNAGGTSFVTERDNPLFDYCPELDESVNNFCDRGNFRKFLQFQYFVNPERKWQEWTQKFSSAYNEEWHDDRSSICNGTRLAIEGMGAQVKIKAIAFCREARDLQEALGLPLMSIDGLDEIEI